MIIVVVASAAVLVVGGYLGRDIIVPPDVGADVADPRRIALGQQVYAANCASCHGSQLKWQPNWRERLPSGELPARPLDGNGHSWHHPDSQLFVMVKDGMAALGLPDYKTRMPVFSGKLADGEIWAALAFIKSRWPKAIRHRQEGVNERSKR